MTDARNILSSCKEMAQKVLVLFHTDESAAIDNLNKLKTKLSEKAEVKKEECELFEACRYNALATINSAPVQNKKNAQLTEALMEAVLEIEAICEIL